MNLSGANAFKNNVFINVIIDVSESENSSCNQVIFGLFVDHGRLLRTNIGILIVSTNGITFSFEILKDSFWYSEAQIQSPFKSRCKGDPFSESRTHTDGAFGTSQSTQKQNQDSN
ncbi:MAG: hypothetical protein ACXACP_02880 [Candidatus Hodarchaeales archaeon]